MAVWLGLEPEARELLQPHEGQGSKQRGSAHHRRTAEDGKRQLLTEARANFDQSKRHRADLEKAPLASRHLA